MNERTATGMRTREQWRVSELRYRRKTAMQQPLLQPPPIDDHPEVVKYLREAVEREFEVVATVGGHCRWKIRRIRTFVETATRGRTSPN